MSDCFTYMRGSSPLLLSVPHDGRQLASGMAERMTDSGLALPDTDWHVGRLYGFAASLGANVIEANYSRYVVDLNRAADDAALYAGQKSTGLCPLESFSGDALYKEGETCDADDQAARVPKYWAPYHQKIAEELQRLSENFGYALLWDAHSIKTNVPTLFDGELPDLNIGTNSGASCSAALQAAVAAVAEASTYSSVVNGRFKGGYITRQYGGPENGVHAIQMELAQHCYMDEGSLEYDESLAAELGSTLQRMLAAFIETAESEHSR